MPLPIYGPPDNGSIGGSLPVPPSTVAVIDVQVGSGSPQVGHVLVTAAGVGLGNVNNTSDANKPVSTATQAVLDTHSSQIAILQAGGGGTSEPLLD